MLLFDHAAHARNVLGHGAAGRGGLTEGELKTLHEMAVMIARRLEADMAAAARASAKDELLRSLDFVRAPFALCTLALGRPREGPLRQQRLGVGDRCVWPGRLQVQDAGTSRAESV